MSEPPARFADQVFAIRARRQKLADDLDQLTLEGRAEMGQRAEKLAWTVVGSGSAILAGAATRRLLMTGWRLIRKDEPPNNPADTSVGWADALAWTAATGLGVATARLFAGRGAAGGWRRYMGTTPPGLR